MSERWAAAKAHTGDDQLPGHEVSPRTLREWISLGFTRVEDLVYIGLGVLLAGSALVLLGAGAFNFWQGLWWLPWSLRCLCCGGHTRALLQ